MAKIAKTPRKSPTTPRMTLYMPIEAQEEIIRAATDLEISISEFVRQAITFFIEERKKQQFPTTERGLIFQTLFKLDGLITNLQSGLVMVEAFKEAEKFHARGEKPAIGVTEFSEYRRKITKELEEVFAELESKDDVEL